MALSLQAMAFSLGASGTMNQNMYASPNSRYSASMLNGNTNYTGEGVGTGFLSCGCAEQILAKRVIPGSPCENFSRLTSTAFASPNSVTGTSAPASPQVHQN